MAATSMVHKTYTFTAVTKFIIDNYAICFTALAVNRMFASVMLFRLLFAGDLNVITSSALGYFDPGWNDKGLATCR